MRDKEFKNWLIKKGGSKKTSSDKRSRAKRAEKLLSDYLQTDLDLDNEYKKDQCSKVLHLLNGKTVDELPDSFKLPKKKDLLAHYRHAVSKYVEFCEETVK